MTILRKYYQAISNNELIYVRRSMGSKSDYKKFDDSMLVESFIEGDILAFNEIYDRYWTPLVLHAQRMTKDIDLAQDVVQEVFTSIFKNPSAIRQDTTLAPYLYSSIRNKIFNLIRHDKIKAAYIEDIGFFMKNDALYGDEELRVKELVGIINEEINKMPPKMREIFKLSREQYLSRKEIADLLGVTEHTVRTQIQRALKLLQSNQHLRVSVALFTCYMIN